MSNARGIILPSVLIFLMIFTLLGVSALTLGILEFHISHNTATDLAELQALEAGLTAAERKLELEFASGHLKTFPQDEIISINTIPVHCAFEFLTTIEDRDYYCITVSLKPTKNDSKVLQSTVALANEKPCNEGVRQVKVGRLSWREIS